ncbi:F-box protein At5g07610 [Brachypodium distachyon]|uniref:F-box domain-containing protein n=1 Tax=Brachypodium distachyon TaxID=15368 RepID=I1GVX3_BRADI|nr:F-box protein At5g07610 [Brachypodium distachyon]KQK17011.1 hypothetical protein BRADI_1g31950v3 [Brachypodium distachyon]KQK17012.1 hypothetical protein BRADI_1g31950v3 [Brachypodium distachyon]KQK17013.1 hypothetical protein BRADI_1g31950v3 [Brachypodium distachyon]|eukprot:XP_010240443.1 F-box protein At5g07610 [Brachypodium distachyon]
MDRVKKTSSPAADLTDDLIVEILSRLPAKSICRFKCVSPHWRSLITDRANRRKLPQTLSGFFRHTVGQDGHNEPISVPVFYSIVSGLGEEEKHVRDPSLSFLPGCYKTIIPKDCCNGLLLCLCWKGSPKDESNYVVCNPATEKWVILPQSDQASQLFVRHVGFDPAVSSHFHVFSVLEGLDGYTTGVDVYSSEAKAWSYKENGWADETVLYEPSVFLNGMMHFVSCEFTIVALDTQGKSWRTIPLLQTMGYEDYFYGNCAIIGQSQGHLHYLNVRERDASTLSVWTLSNYCSGEWLFKYNINIFQLFGWKDVINQRQWDYTLVAIHPECSLIFYILHHENMLLSYDMDHGKVHVIRKLKEHYYGATYIPYVPLFTESLVDHE